MRGSIHLGPPTTLKLHLLVWKLALADDRQDADQMIRGNVGNDLPPVQQLRPTSAPAEQ